MTLILQQTADPWRMRSHFQRHQARRYPAEELFQRLPLADYFPPRDYFPTGSQRAPATAAVSQIKPDRYPTRPTAPGDRHRKQLLLSELPDRFRRLPFSGRTVTDLQGRLFPDFN